MKHAVFQEWLVLSVYDELSEEESVLLERHVAGCSECRGELSELRSLHRKLTETSPAIDPKVLYRSRRRLFRNLENETGWRAWWNSWGHPVFSKLGYAAGALSVAGLGLLTGYLLFSPSAAVSDRWSELDPFAERLEVFDVRFQEAPQAGQVELSFYAARRFQILGQATDPQIQKILAYALLNEENPGTRLRAVNTLGREAHKGDDRVIQTTLISALKMDDNAAVRQRALEALRQYPVSRTIEEALLYVLVNDENPRLRIEAIESLEETISRRQTVATDIRRILQDRSQEDSNDYVRLRAQAILREVNQ